MSVSENNVAEFPEEGSLQRFGEEISEHVFCVAMSDGNVVLFEAVRDPEVSNVDVAGPLSGRVAAVLGEFDGTFGVLLEISVCDWVALGFHEMFHPDSMGEVVTGADKLGFRGAFSVNFLFGGTA